MKYSYARTSTDDQTTALQLAAFKRARCSRIFADKGLSGASVKRPTLSRCLKTLRAGDTLIVWKLDRLGRSLRDLIAMLDDLRARSVKFQSLSEATDTTTPTGRATWQMIGVLAELERSLISERTRAGVKAAQRRGADDGDCYGRATADFAKHSVIPLRYAPIRATLKTWRKREELTSTSRPPSTRRKTRRPLQPLMRAFATSRLAVPCLSQRSESSCPSGITTSSSPKER